MFLFLSSGVFNYFLFNLRVFHFFFRGGMGSLNFILAFCFVFLVMVLAPWFLLWYFFFQENNSFCELWGIFCFFKVWGSSNFLKIILGVLIFFFSCEGGCFALVNFEIFLFYYFEVSESLIFFVILWVLKKNCVKFRKGERGVFAFLLVDFKSFLFLYFEVMKFSIFLFVFWGSLIYFFGVKGGGFALVDFESFCFTILKLWSFQFFFLSFYGSSKKFVWSFTKGENGVFSFLLVNFESCLFSYF